MQTTDQIDGNDIDAVAESLVISEKPEDEQPSNEVETKADEAPVEDEQTDEDEVEAEGDEIVDEDVDEDEEDEAEQEDEAEPELYTVKVDGVETQVTREELTRGYAGQEYIQKGMKEVADAKKDTESQKVEAEQIFNALQHERQQLAQFYNNLQQQGIKTSPQPPAAELASTDPISYMEQKAHYDADLVEYQTQQSQFQQLTAQQAEAENVARGKYLAEQTKKLVELIPEMADANKAGEIQRKITQSAHDAYGFTAQEIEGIHDARHLKVLHDAVKYRELQNSKRKVVEKAKKARPVIKAGVKPQRGASAKKAAATAMARMRATGSVDDVADFLLQKP